jgi:hypothetical protein
MAEDNSSLTKLKAAGNALFRTFGSDFLNGICWPFGSLIDLGTAYRDQRAAQNMAILIKDLEARVDNLEDRLKSIVDGATAEKIQQVILQVLREPNEEKIGFFASIIAGDILQLELDWDKELQIEFIATIGQLSGPELIILRAMFRRTPGEALMLTSRGNTWLDPQIVINKSTEAWIDSLVKKGLVVDASIEQIQMGFGSPGHNSVKSGSAVRLSTFARSMIEYMLQMQATAKS